MKILLPLLRPQLAAALIGGSLLLAGCAGTGNPPVRTNDRDSAHALAGDQLRVLIWNVHKASDDEWIGDFRTIAADSDLVLLQEAHLHREFVDGLVGLPRWDLVEAWHWRNAPTGVLTGSDVAPLRVHALEHREPLLRTGKSALITEYRITGSDHTLLVANMHLINFTIDTRAFRAQLAEVAALLRDHQGPVILSGDLNTWRAERRAVVHEIAAALGLAEVAFDGPRKQFLRFPLDHVFYRGLAVQATEVPAVGSSDHNPLLVTFRLAQDGDQVARQDVLPVPASMMPASVTQEGVP